MMGGDAQVLSREMEQGFEDVKSSLGRVEVRWCELKPVLKALGLAHETKLQ